jgi:hypothetical protein
MISDKRKLSVKFVDDFYSKWVKACLIIDGFEAQYEVIKNYDNEGYLKSLADMNNSEAAFREIGGFFVSITCIKYAYD